MALNFSAQEQVVKLAENGRAHILVSTQMDRTDGLDLSEIRLRANEGILMQLER